ncbi:hypothetical protein F2P56_023696 [Juglans regia]|uniref:Uncharacterized protein n=1 Tax=Juglans regia TaxID=51240 RepID=A0A833U5Z0_JUGRE|nr:hypothetical protein F2P56_023696 [Juglans regia]
MWGLNEIFMFACTVAMDDSSQATEPLTAARVESNNEQSGIPDDNQLLNHHEVRKAAESVVVKLPLLHQFFEGNVPVHGQDPTASYPQFPDLFPPQLHPLSQLNNRYKIVHNIIFISNPEIFYIKPEDTERFKRLTGL